MRYRVGSIRTSAAYLALLGLAVLIGAYLFILGPGDTAEADLDLSLLARAYGQSAVNDQMLQSGRTRVIPAAAFRDDGFGDQSYGVTYSWGSLGPINANGYCVQAPVYLPDGAQVTSLRAHALDNEASGDIWRIEIRRKALNSLANSQVMASAPTSGANGAVRMFEDNTISQPVVDNDNYFYFSAVCASGGNGSLLRFIAVAIDFAHYAHLPLIQNNVCGERPSGRESEPNENRGQANGICNGVPVLGYPNDSYPGAELDWYRFEWDGQGSVQVDLTNFVTDGQLILYKGNSELGKDFNNTTLQVIEPGAGPGTYYVLVTAGVSRPNPGVDYTLTVTIK
jgi:hypothetical protein